MGIRAERLFCAGAREICSNLRLMRVLPVALLLLAACAPRRIAEVARVHDAPPPTQLIDAGTKSVEPSSGVPPTVKIDPKPLLAKHRMALGGDAAIAKAARMRVRQKTKDVGLEGLEVYVLENGRMRAESVIPVLRAESIEIWDRERLAVRGWNGDVRLQGPEDRRYFVTVTSLRSLGYLREASTRIDGLPSIDEGGTSYERLLIVPEGGSPAELWLRPDGLAHKVILDKKGRKTTRVFESYGKYGPLLVPKVVKKSDSMKNEVDTETVESVEFLLAPLEAKTFERPPAKLDVSFPKQTHKITLPAAMLNGRYLTVSGSVGGRSATFLLDTGASMTVMDHDFLVEAGVKAAGGATYKGAALFKGLQFARIPGIDVGGMKVGSQVVYAIPLRKNSGFPLQVDGILGYDFWSRFVTSVDYPAGTLTFHRPGTFVQDPADVRIPFELEGTSVHVPVSINGKSAGTFELDTGNGGECTVHRFDGADQLVPTGPAPLRFARGITYGSSSAAAYKTSLELGVGPFVYKSAPVLLLDPKDPAGAATSGNGNIGVSFLKSFVVTFDYASSAVYLRQKRGLRPASTVGVSGVSLKRLENGDFAIDEVVPGWPGDKAHLKADDIIVSVDGVPQTEDDLGEFIPGESKQVEIRRGTEALRTTLVAAQHP